MNPEEFYEKMLQLKNDFGDDEEEVHSRMDELMCDALSALGYGDGVDIFNRTNKWYS